MALNYNQGALFTEGNNRARLSDLGKVVLR